jgi:hypothetical protein
MIKIKSEINKTAHYLAQVSQIQIRYALENKCQRLIKEGKSANDVAQYLKQLASGGVKELDKLLGN